MRCLPVADDCGVSSPVTEIILRCIDAKALRGTSVLAGGACAHEAAHALGMRLYRQPELAVGVHLNLLEGRCISAPADVPLLADDHGWFRHGLGSLWAAVTFGSGTKKAALLEQMIWECRAQVESVHAAVRAGWVTAWAADHPEAEPDDAPACPPCYLDGHLHIHSIPAFRPVLGALLEAYRFRHVRIPAELRQWMPAPLSLQLVGGMRRELLSVWGGGLRVFLQERGVAFPHFFAGAFASGGMTLPLLRESLAAIHERAPAVDALVEIMFHPSPAQGAIPEGGRVSPPPVACSVMSSPHPESPVSLHALPADASIAARQRQLGAAYATPSRQAEGALLLSTEYQQLMARHDPSWAGEETR